jgi:uncharacterized protein (UPF0216 family)
MALALHYRQVLSTSEISKIVIFGRFEVKVISEVVVEFTTLHDKPFLVIL